MADAIQDKQMQRRMQIIKENGNVISFSVTDNRNVTEFINEESVRGVPARRSLAKYMVSESIFSTSKLFPSNVLVFVYAVPPLEIVL